MNEFDSMTPLTTEKEKFLWSEYNKALAMIAEQTAKLDAAERRVVILEADAKLPRSQEIQGIYRESSLENEINQKGLRILELENQISAIESIVKGFGYESGTTIENLKKFITWSTGEIKRLREGEKRAEAYMAKLQAMIPIERRVELAKEMEGNWVALMARKG